MELLCSCHHRVYVQLWLGHCRCLHCREAFDAFTTTYPLLPSLCPKWQKQGRQNFLCKIILYIVYYYYNMFWWSFLAWLDLICWLDVMLCPFVRSMQQPTALRHMMHLTTGWCVALVQCASADWSSWVSFLGCLVFVFPFLPVREKLILDNVEIELIDSCKTEAIVELIMEETTGNKLNMLPYLGTVKAILV